MAGATQIVPAIVRMLIRALPSDIQGAAKHASIMANVIGMEHLSAPLAGPRVRLSRRRPRLTDSVQRAVRCVELPRRSLIGASQIVTTILGKLPSNFP